MGRAAIPSHTQPVTRVARMTRSIDSDRRLERVRIAAMKCQTARQWRDEMIRTAVASGVDRHEVATAAGLVKSRIDQIVRGE